MGLYRIRWERDGETLYSTYVEAQERYGRNGAATTLAREIEAQGYRNHPGMTCGHYLSLTSVSSVGPNIHVDGR